MGEIVRLPASASRGQQGVVFLKLLKRVDALAKDGFGFEGAFFRPGAHVERDKLWPTPDYPRVPILLECAGATGFTIEGLRARGHLRSESLYILWRLNFNNDWMEIARARSDSAAWASDLAPLAIRALAASAPPVVLVDADVMREQIASYLAAQLAHVAPGERAGLLAVLHDEIAGRLGD